MKHATKELSKQWWTNAQHHASVNDFVISQRTNADFLSWCVDCPSKRFSKSSSPSAVCFEGPHPMVDSLCWLGFGLDSVERCGTVGESDQQTQQARAELIEPRRWLLKKPLSVRFFVQGPKDLVFREWSLKTTLLLWFLCTLLWLEEENYLGSCATSWLLSLNSLISRSRSL